MSGKRKRRERMARERYRVQLIDESRPEVPDFDPEAMAVERATDPRFRPLPKPEAKR